MDVKLIEIRDRNTMVPAMVVRVASVDDEEGDWLLRKAGYSLDGRTVILMRLVDCDANYDVYRWSDSRTMRNVHHWIEQPGNFESLARFGSVVDVEFILGEHLTCKLSERVDPYGQRSRELEEAARGRDR